MLTPDDLLERTQWDTFWIPDDVTVVDRPELRYLRCERDIPMLNTVVRTRGAAADLPGKVAEVAAAHQGVRSRWLVRDLDLRPALEKALAAAGYRPSFPTRAYTIGVDAHQAPAKAACTVWRVARLRELEDAIRVSEQAFEAPSHTTAAERRAYLTACRHESGRVHRFVAYDDQTGLPLSTGGMTHYPELCFCLLWAGSTVVEARGRGAYRAVLAARIDKARALRATRVGLYAHVETSAPIVARLGFERHGPMTFWDLPPS